MRLLLLPAQASQTLAQVAQTSLDRGLPSIMNLAAVLHMSAQVLRRNKEEKQYKSNSKMRAQTEGWGFMMPGHAQHRIGAQPRFPLPPHAQLSPTRTHSPEHDDMLFLLVLALERRASRG